MKFHIETERLILRQLQLGDIGGIFELNANTEVQKFVGNKPIKNLAEAKAAIDFVIEQYQTNGIGRWAVIEKETGAFTGWSGLKLIRDEMNAHQNFYELGYRFIPKYWGKGFATETAKASINYGFKNLKLDVIYAITDYRNEDSSHVLQKAGFELVETFDLGGIVHNWFSLKKQTYERRNFSSV